MSFHEAFAWTLLRSVVAAGLAVPMSVALSRLVGRATGRARFCWMLFVLCPLVAPDLVVGYAYRSFELSLLHRPDWNHIFYFALIVLKFLPAAVVIQLCLPPPPLSESALHCASLAGSRKSVGRRIESLKLKTDFLRSLPIFGIVFLLTMQEFEIASLLQIPAWTVHLFDSQAGGLNVSATLSNLTLPVLAQAFVVIPLACWGMKKPFRRLRDWSQVETSASRPVWTGAMIAIVAAILTWAIPLITVSWSGLSGFAGVIRNEILVRSALLDLAAAIAVASPCAMLALILIRRFGLTARSSTGNAAGSRNLQVKTLQSVLLTILALPGLFGSLAVSIVVLSTIQHPPLTALRATVWPMAFALVLFLIPRAMFLTILVPVFLRSESSHLATLLGGSSDSVKFTKAANLKWHYECRPLFLVLALLFYWSLANLTTSALLCPPTIPLLSFNGNIVPLPVRLYGFIHQGRTAALSVMAVLSVVVPLVLILLAGWMAPSVYLRLTRFGASKPQSADLPCS